MDYQHILYEDSGASVRLTLNRPEVLNALAPTTLEELIHALDRVRDEGSARALLLAAAGRAFCAGADLSASASVAAAPTARRDAGAGLERYYNPLVERMRRLPVPIVVAVNGAAAGGGCGLALAGDIIVAARSAYFLQPFANIGLVPDVAATWLLPRLVGRARATAMMMLGQRVPAETARDWGMIYDVVDDAELKPAAWALVERLAQGPTQAYGLMRQGIADCMELGLTQALALERDHQRIAGLTLDHQEGVRAFLEKRSPTFTGA